MDFEKNKGVKAPGGKRFLIEEGEKNTEKIFKGGAF